MFKNSQYIRSFKKVDMATYEQDNIFGKQLQRKNVGNIMYNKGG